MQFIVSIRTSSLNANKLGTITLANAGLAQPWHHESASFSILCAAIARELERLAELEHKSQPPSRSQLRRTA